MIIEPPRCARCDRPVQHLDHVRRGVTHIFTAHCHGQQEITTFRPGQPRGVTALLAGTAFKRVDVEA